MKKQALITVLAFAAFVSGSAVAQHDSLSCRTALTGMLRKKADMQTLNEYDPDTYQKKFPLYLDAFRALIDSLDLRDLWKYVPDPWELKIEKARLDFATDPTFEKRLARQSIERTLSELRRSPAVSRRGMDYAELCHSLGTLYYQIGDIPGEIRICRDALAVLRENRRPGEIPSLLEWMIRSKLANALLASSPAEALPVIGPIEFQDTGDYRDYAVNSWRTERLENTIASAWEALGNVRSALGDGRAAISAYEKAMQFTRPGRPTWDSIVLSIVKLQAETGNVTEVNRWAGLVRRLKPENLLSVYLVSGNAYHEKKTMDAASEAYQNAFGLLRKASAEEQIKVLSSLVRIYADLGLQDRIFETLSVLMKDRDFVKNDELSTTFSNACVTLGIQVRRNEGRYRDYFKAAEKVLLEKASSGMDFLNNRHAGRTLVLLTRLYLARMEGDDLEQAGRRVEEIGSGYRAAARRLGLAGDYASDDVVFAKLAAGTIAELRGDAAAAAELYMGLASDYSAAVSRGDLRHHNSAEGLDSSAARLFRISDGYLKRKAFDRARGLCERLSRAGNLPVELRQKAEFMTAKADYRWGFAERSRFQQALAGFNRIGPGSGWRREADFMAALCQWILDFKDAAVDNLIAGFSGLKDGHSSERLTAFLKDENLFGYGRVISEGVFTQGNGEKAGVLLEAVLEAISGNRIDTPEEARALYGLARITLANGLPKEKKLVKVDGLLEAFFRNAHATDDRWTYFRAGELRMDLDFELGRLTSAVIRRQIQQLQGFGNSKEELLKIIESRNFYGGPGLFSLEDLDMAGLGEKVSELTGKCHYMLGRVYGRENRWKDAVEAYDVVLDRYSRFDEYASKALYQEGLIYLVELNRIDRAVERFTALFSRYGRSQLAVQAVEDMREAQRMAKSPAEISAWFKACKKMFRGSGEPGLPRFAMDLMLYLAERHTGEDERFTRDRAVQSAVAAGVRWLALLSDTASARPDDLAKANLVLARAIRLESDLRRGSVYLRFGVTYPEKTAEEENLCYRRAMAHAKDRLLFREAQWRLTVNLALMEQPEESKVAAWIHRAADAGDTSLRGAYEKEIGVLVAYAAPGRRDPYTRDVRIAVESIVVESAPAGLLPLLAKAFERTRKQVEVLKWKSRRLDIRPDVLDIRNYPNGRWSGGELK